MRKDKDIKDRKAVALSYKEEYNAPKVVAKGKGEIADKILEVGKDEKIQVYEDENLVEDLLKIELNDEIPPELYDAVSQIIIFVYSLDKEKEDAYGK